MCVWQGEEGSSGEAGEGHSRTEGRPGLRAFEPSNITVGEFFAQYEDAVRHTMKRRSFETYLDIARLHLLPAFGPLKPSS